MAPLTENWDLLRDVVLVVALLVLLGRIEWLKGEVMALKSERKGVGSGTGTALTQQRPPRIEAMDPGAPSPGLVNPQAAPEPPASSARGASIRLEPARPTDASVQDLVHVEGGDPKPPSLEGEAGNRELAGTAADVVGPQEYSANLVQELYRGWCSTGERPEVPPTVELVPVTHINTDRNVDGTVARSVLRDADQYVQFVRFSAPRATHALLFPDPGARYATSTSYLFVGLNQANYGGDSLSQLAPVTIRRCVDGSWETE